MTHISLPVLVAMTATALTSFSRVFDATKPAWGMLPAWLQVMLPLIISAAGFIVSQLAGVKTPTDLTVAIVGGLMVILPGWPSHRSAAPLPRNAPSTST